MHVIRRFLGLLVALAAVATALAHDPGLSSVRLRRTGDTIVIEMAFAWTDVARLVDGTEKNRPDVVRLAALAPALAQAADGFARISSAGILLPAAAPEIAPDKTTPADVLVTLKWSHLPSDPVEAVFPILAHLPFGHRMLVTQGSAAEAIALLDSRHAEWILPAAAPGGTPRAVSATERSAPLPWFSFIPLGIEHILTGYDHLCFLLALLLVALRFRDVLAVVTTFTIAHSLTLGAAALVVVSLPSSVV